MSTLPRQLSTQPSDVDLEALAGDGAVVLRNVLDLSWIESMRGSSRPLTSNATSIRPTSLPGLSNRATS